jgi:hypothetical protein
MSSVSGGGAHVARDKYASNLRHMISENLQNVIRQATGQLIRPDKKVYFSVYYSTCSMHYGPAHFALSV